MCICICIWILVNQYNAQQGGAESRGKRAQAHRPKRTADKGSKFMGTPQRPSGPTMPTQGLSKPAQQGLKRKCPKLNREGPNTGQGQGPSKARAQPTRKEELNKGSRRGPTHKGSSR